MDEQSEPRPQPLPQERPALVVGFDRHSASHAALGFASGLAVRLGARLHVVHVLDLEDTPVDADADGGSWSRHVEQELERSREEVGGVLSGSGIEWEYHRRTGDPAGVLAASADEHDALMILVGCPPHSLRAALDNILGGATADDLVRRSTRPVVLVPTGGRPPSHAADHERR